MPQGNERKTAMFKKIVVASVVIFILVWFPLSFVFRGIIPDEFRQGIFYWITLYALTVAHLVFKLKAKIILFLGLILIATGGALSVTGNIQLAEFTLRFGYVFMLIGTLVALLKVIKNVRNK